MISWRSFAASMKSCPYPFPSSKGSLAVVKPCPKRSKVKIDGDSATRDRKVEMHGSQEEAGSPRPFTKTMRVWHGCTFGSKCGAEDGKKIWEIGECGFVGMVRKDGDGLMVAGFEDIFAISRDLFDWSH